MEKCVRLSSLIISFYKRGSAYFTCGSYLHEKQFYLRQNRHRPTRATGTAVHEVSSELRLSLAAVETSNRAAKKTSFIASKQGDDEGNYGSLVKAVA